MTRSTLLSFNVW